MKIKKQIYDTFRTCDFKYCRYMGKEIYLLDELTKEEYEYLGLDRKIFRGYNELCYMSNMFWTKICPRHFNEIFKRYKNYMMWCSI